VPAGTTEDYAGGRIERVNLATGRFERVYDTVDGQPLRGPNDLVFDAAGGFYFTDLGKSRPADMDRGGLYYALVDGKTAVTVSRPLMTPNGVALSPDGKTLYYAETEGARVWAFDLAAPGKITRQKTSPHGARLLAASPGGHYQMFDSMAVDAFGNVCVATIARGGISVIAPDGSACSHVPMPDPITTNICFGGPGHRTAFITLSGTGKLVAVDDWPVPGLPLSFEA
jgi:gluconolactonase